MMNASMIPLNGPPTGIFVVTAISAVSETQRLLVHVYEYGILLVLEVQKQSDVRTYIQW